MLFISEQLAVYPVGRRMKSVQDALDIFPVFKPWLSGAHEVTGSDNYLLYLVFGFMLYLLPYLIPNLNHGIHIDVFGFGSVVSLLSGSLILHESRSTINPVCSAHERAES